MKLVQLSIGLTDKLGIKQIVFDHNDTGLESNAELLKRIAIALLKGLELNKDDILIQDLLSDLGIRKSDEPEG